MSFKGSSKNNRVKQKIRKQPWFRIEPIVLIQRVFRNCRHVWDTATSHAWSTEVWQDWARERRQSQPSRQAGESRATQGNYEEEGEFHTSAMDTGSTLSQSRQETAPTWGQSQFHQMFQLLHPDASWHQEISHWLLKWLKKQDEGQLPWSQPIPLWNMGIPSHTSWLWKVRMVGSGVRIHSLKVWWLRLTSLCDLENINHEGIEANSRQRQKH